VEIFYGGIRVDPDNNNLEEKMFLFAQSPKVTLQPGGKQDVVLNSFEWIDKVDAQGQTRLFPNEYGCPQNTGPADAAHSSVPWPVQMPTNSSHNLHIHFNDSSGNPTNAFGTPVLKRNGTTVSSNFTSTHDASIDISFQSPATDGI
jgi:hypothetical protein